MNSEGGASRRALLGAMGAAMAGTVTLAGCGRRKHIARQAVKHASTPVQRRDVQILAAALALERRTVAAYTAGIPLLGRDDAKAAKQFLDEELQHTGELLALITAAGGGSVPRAASYDIGHPRGSADVLAQLHALERAQVVNYLKVITELSPGPVRAGVASILANDAQHISILRLAQGASPAPSAFVTGAQ